MRRLDRALLTLAATSLVVGVLARPVARATSPAFAAWEQCPIDDEDRQVLASRDAEGRTAAGGLHLDALDPWGQPYRLGRSPAVYSTGPDGVDAGGAGDDVEVEPNGAYSWLVHAPLWGGGVALLLGWALLALRPRAARVEHEAARAAVLALLPAAGAAWLVATSPRLTESLAPLGERLVVPVPVATVGAVAFLAYLLALAARLRLTRPVEPEGAPAPVRWGRLALAGLLLVVLAGASGAWVVHALRAAARERLLLRAHLGLPSAIRDVLASGDGALVADFVRRPPAGFAAGELSDAPLQAIADVGSDAWPLLVGALRGEHQGLRTIALDFVRAHDPERSRLADEVSRDPAAYPAVVRDLWRELLPRLGRRALLDLLAPGLDDTGPGQGSINGFTLRRCDHQLGVMLSVVGAAQGAPAPPATYTAEAFDAAIRDLRAFLRRGRLPPARWLRVEIARAPAGEELELRCELGPGEGYYGSRSTLEEPTRVEDMNLGPDVKAITIAISGQPSLTVAVPPPGPADEVVELRVDATTGAHDVHVTPLPER